ncbi:SDR family NAD(P)-dependent oxidoreductase [Actinomycetospora sp. C-140]
MTVRHGHVALVTGGASGAGAAISTRLAADGYKVAVVDRDAEAATRVAGECGGVAVACDVTSDTAIRAAVDEAVGWGRRLDVVVLHAATPGGGSGAALDVEAYRRTTAATVDHVVFGLHAALPALRRAGGGTVIATSSLAGLTGVAGDAIGALAQHAVVGFVRSAAATLIEERVRVMAVCADDTTDEVAEAVGGVLARGATGECWVARPGREPEPFRFADVPGPAGADARPPHSRERGR